MNVQKAGDRSKRLSAVIIINYDDDFVVEFKIEAQLRLWEVLVILNQMSLKYTNYINTKVAH